MSDPPAVSATEAPEDGKQKTDRGHVEPAFNGLPIIKQCEYNLSIEQLCSQRSGDR